MEKTVASLHLKLDNKNVFDTELNALDYQVRLADINISGAELSMLSNLQHVR